MTLFSIEKGEGWRKKLRYLPKNREHLNRVYIGLKKCSYAFKDVSIDTSNVRAHPLFSALSWVCPLSQGVPVIFPLLVMRVLVGDISK